MRKFLTSLASLFAFTTIFAVAGTSFVGGGGGTGTLDGSDTNYLARSGDFPMSGDLDMGVNSITNADTIKANQMVVGGLYDPTDGITLVYDVDGRRMTNIVNIGFADGTVQTTAPAGGVGVGDDLYYEGGSVKLLETEIPLAALNNSNGDPLIYLIDGEEKIMFEPSVTNIDLFLGIIYGKNSGKIFLNYGSTHSIYGSTGIDNLELEHEFVLRDSAGDVILRFMNDSQALVYDGGTVKAFALDGAAPQINDSSGTKILQLDAEVGLYGANANQIVGLGGAAGYHINDSAGLEKFIDLTDGGEAIYWGAGANIFFDPSAAMGINYNDGSVAWDMGTTYSIHGPAAAGIAVDLANWQLQVAGVKTLDWNAGKLYDPSDGTTLIMDWNTRRLTNIVNVAFADGTVQETASITFSGSVNGTNTVYWLVGTNEYHLLLAN